MKIPAIFTRAQIIAAFDALGMTEEEADTISRIEITGTQVEIGTFLYSEEGYPITSGGEPAQVFYTVMIDEDA